MKKICFITTVSMTLRTFVLDTAAYLHEHGDYDITFICDNDEKFVKSLPEYIHFIPVSMSRGVNLGFVSAVRELFRVFQSQHFDIVQYSTPNASLYASVAAKLAKVPVRLYCQWGIRYVGFSGVMRVVFRVIEKIVCYNSTAIRAVSPKNMAFAVNEGLYPETKVKVLGKGGTIGVDLREYPLDMKSAWKEEVRRRLDVPAGYVFGFAGRLSRDKGGNELLQAFHDLNTEESVRLLIVGPDEAGQDVDCKLMEWAKQDERVIFTGMVPKPEMPKYYAAMDALVHPTYREGFGMVLQEAAAMELPVLTTDVPGASEVLENGASCMLCEAKSVSDLKDKMEMLLDKTTAELMGKAARVRVEQLFERSQMLQRQFEDYESM